eukprot:6290534-Alexandrium_andersonii.AAC.1
MCFHGGAHGVNATACAGTRTSRFHGMQGAIHPRPGRIMRHSALHTRAWTDMISSSYGFGVCLVSMPVHASPRSTVARMRNGACSVQVVSVQAQALACALDRLDSCVSVHPHLAT